MGPDWERVEIQIERVLVVMELISLLRQGDTEYKQVYTIGQEVLITRKEMGDREFHAGSGVCDDFVTALNCPPVGYF